MFEVIKCPGNICWVKNDQTEKNNDNHILVYSSHLLFCEDKALPSNGFEETSENGGWFSYLVAKTKVMTA